MRIIRLFVSSFVDGLFSDRYTFYHRLRG